MLDMFFYNTTDFLNCLFSIVFENYDRQTRGQNIEVGCLNQFFLSKNYDSYFLFSEFSFVAA